MCTVLIHTCMGVGVGTTHLRSLPYVSGVYPFPPAVSFSLSSLHLCLYVYILVFVSPHVRRSVRESVSTAVARWDIHNLRPWSPLLLGELLVEALFGT